MTLNKYKTIEKQKKLEEDILAHIPELETDIVFGHNNN